LETLYDDRVEESAGVKLNDADLLGLPLRLVVSPRNVKAGAVEIKARSAAEAKLLSAGDAPARIRQMLEEASRGRSGVG